MLFIKTIRNTLFILAVFGGLISCKTTQTLGPQDDGLIEIAILQMNDVYEIAGVDGGKLGDLSRVSTVYQELKKQYPLSLMVLAGDFLNPSLVGTMRYEGERIRGRQMIETLNAMSLDYVAFGNHEFDISETDLQKRINESHFTWLANNIQQVCGAKEYPFYKEVAGKKQFLPAYDIVSLTDADGTSINLGIFTAVINSNPVDYVHYYSADSMIAESMAILEEKADLAIGLTHLTVTQDIALAQKYQQVPLIMGGHEHDHMYHEIGKSVVAKADANAKTIYIHKLKINKRTGTAELLSELRTIDNQIAREPEVAKVVDKWQKILEDQVKEIIANPYEIVYEAETPLDGRESSMRHRSTNMGELFAASFKASSQKKAEAAIFNSGSVRIDDQLSGQIVAIDIFRALPFGGSVYDVEMKGSLLKGVLRYSDQHKGDGAYLQTSGIAKNGEDWQINGQAIDDARYYRIAITDFLLRGLDIPFLTEQNEGVKSVDKPVDSKDLRYDLRKAIIDYLRKQ